MLGYHIPPDQAPPCTVHAGGYGQQAGGMHPTGMHSCYFYFTCIPVGCLPPTSVVTMRCQSWGVSVQGVSVKGSSGSSVQGGGLCPKRVYVRGSFWGISVHGGFLSRGSPSRGETRSNLTDTRSENITFPHLRLRVVKMIYF